MGSKCAPPPAQETWSNTVQREICFPFTSPFPLVAFMSANLHWQIQSFNSGKKEWQGENNRGEVSWSVSLLCQLLTLKYMNLFLSLKSKGMKKKKVSENEQQSKHEDKSNYYIWIKLIQIYFRSDEWTKGEYKANSFSIPLIGLAIKKNLCFRLREYCSLFLVNF